MNNILRLLLIVFFYQGCTTWRQNLNSHGNTNIAIENAVLDFYNTSPLINQDNTFSVRVKELSLDIIGVNIMGTINNFIVTADGKSSEMPTRYIELGGNLFYWHDDGYFLNDSTINKLNQYKLIDSIPSFAMVELINDDSKKGIDYFFCKKNLNKYKKVKTTRILGRYAFTKLKCE